MFYLREEEKQECILSARPTIYSTITPPPHPSTHGQVVFASKSWRCEGKGKGEGGEEEVKEEEKMDPHFFYRGPPLYPPCRRPPYPLHRVYFYLIFFVNSPFWPGWWCGGGGGGEEGEEGEKVHLLTHGSTSGDHG